MGESINVIVKHKRGTTDKLNASTTPLDDGELVVEYNRNGKRYIKVGDGTNIWRNSKNLSTVESDKWSSPRTITLSQDLSGSVSIDGSSDITLEATVKDNSHNHIIDNIEGLQEQLNYNTKNWDNGRTYFYSMGGAQDKSWKKIFTCSHPSPPASPQYVTCTVKGMIHYINGNYNQEQVWDIPFQITFIAYSDTMLVNNSILYLPATCDLDCIRIVRVSTNTWEIQVRQISDFEKINVQFGFLGNCSIMDPCAPVDSTNTSVVNDYKINVTRQSILDYALAKHTHNYASSLSINGQLLSLEDANGDILNSVTLPSSGGNEIDIYFDEEPVTPANKTIWIGD